MQIHNIYRLERGVQSENVFLDTNSLLECVFSIRKCKKWKESLLEVLQNCNQRARESPAQQAFCNSSFDGENECEGTVRLS